MANVKIYVYVDFGGFLAKRGWENASGPLPDHLAPHPDRKSKFWLHADLGDHETFQMSRQPGPSDKVFLPKSVPQNVIVNEKKVKQKQ